MVDDAATILVRAGCWQWVAGAGLERFELPASEAAYRWRFIADRRATAA